MGPLIAASVINNMRYLYGSNMVHGTLYTYRQNQTLQGNKPTNRSNKRWEALHMGAYNLGGNRVKLKVKSATIFHIYRVLHILSG